MPSPSLAETDTLEEFFVEQSVTLDVVDLAELPTRVAQGSPHLLAAYAATGAAAIPADEDETEDGDMHVVEGAYHDLDLRVYMPADATEQSLFFLLAWESEEFEREPGRGMRMQVALTNLPATFPLAPHTLIPRSYFPPEDRDAAPGLLWTVDAINQSEGNFLAVWTSPEALEMLVNWIEMHRLASDQPHHCPIVEVASKHVLRLLDGLFATWDTRVECYSLEVSDVVAYREEREMYESGYCTPEELSH